MTQAIIQTNLNELLTDSGTIDAVSWQAPKHMTYEQWTEIGQRLQYMSGSLNWWLGDWLNEGEKRWGEKYSQALEITNSKLASLTDYSYVSRNVHFSVRTEKLSWTHHKYISHLSANEQKLWIDHSVKHSLSSRDLKQALEQANAQRKPSPQPDLNWMPEGPKVFPLPSIYTNGATDLPTTYKTYDAQIDDSVDESDYDFDKPREKTYTITDEYGIEETIRVKPGEELQVVPSEPPASNATAYNNHAISEDPDYDGDEWYTPEKYVDAARRVMGDIDLDPASCVEAQAVVQAKNFYTKEDDSLRDDREWFGNVWLNPPYSATLIKKFVVKLIREFDAGNIDAAIIITNNSSDAGWFHSLLERFPACFTRGRVYFWRPNRETFDTRQGQTLFYLGDHEQRFVEEFSALGKVVKAL